MATLCYICLLDLSSLSLHYITGCFLHIRLVHIMVPSRISIRSSIFLGLP